MNKQMNCKLTPYEVKIISCIFKPKFKNHYTMPEDEMMRIISGYFDINKNLLISSTRKKEVVEARMYCMYFLFRTTNYSKKKIGQIFNRDHSTVIHNLDKLKNYTQIYKEHADTLSRLTKKIDNLFLKEAV